MDIGVPELLVVLVIILLIFGPGRIANLSREMGKGIRAFRQGLQNDNQEEESQSSAVTLSQSASDEQERVQLQ